MLRVRGVGMYFRRCETKGRGSDLLGALDKSLVLPPLLIGELGLHAHTHLLPRGKTSSVSCASVPQVRIELAWVGAIRSRHQQFSVGCRFTLALLIEGAQQEARETLDLSLKRTPGVMIGQIKGHILIRKNIASSLAGAEALCEQRSQEGDGTVEWKGKALS